MFDQLVTSQSAIVACRVLAQDRDRPVQPQQSSYHLGAAKASRSTLADADARRPASVFEGMFAALVAKASRAIRRRMGGGSSHQRHDDKAFGQLSTVSADAAPERFMSSMIRMLQFPSMQP